MGHTPRWPFVPFFLGFTFIVGCATYQGKVNKARQQLQKNPERAIEVLEPLAQKEGKDQLVYLFDYATALQAAGRYSESTKVFLKADEMADLKDYLSVSKSGASIILNEEQTQYRGDDYEKVLINVMLALNFLAEGKLDAALVETRRVNEKLDYYRIEEKKKYEQNVFAYYLGAMIWEAHRNWDDAYIAYEKAYSLDSSIPLLKEDLVRSAKKAQRWEKFKEFKKKFGINPKPEWDDKKFGEIVLVYQQGWGPRKGPRIGAPRFPQLFPYPTNTQAARLDVVGGPKVKTDKIYSVQDVAIKTLDDNYKTLVAKRVAGVVAKEVLADQVRQKNELLGALVQFGLHASDRADLRQWSTLPQSLQVARLRLPPGTYKVRVDGLTSSGQIAGESMLDRDVVVRAGKKQFLLWRSYR